MKNIKKLFAVLLTAVLSFCVVNTVSAASNGSIQINNAVIGKTYEIYKIFDLTYSGSNVAYTIDSDWEKFFEESGKDYIIELEKDSDGKVINPNNLNQITIGKVTKYINITESNVAEFSQTALVYAISLTGNDGSMVAESDTLEFTGLDLGYYLIYPQGATDIQEEYASIASITSTLPNAIVNVKAKDPEITKDVNEHTFDVGEYALFTITGQVPNTTGFKTYDYIINDEWTKGLALDKDNVNFIVTIGEETITDVEPVYKENGFTLTFDMTDYQDKVGKTITVTYRLKVTEDAIDSTTTQNSATLSYSNNPKDDTLTTTPPQIERVYSSKIVVTKVDGANNEIKLNGATFILKGSEGYYQAVTSEEGNLLEVKWVENEEEATPYTTDETGIISFKGLKNGEYELIETIAPEGYNKLPESVKVTVSGSYNQDGEGNNIEDEPIPVVTNTTVENHTGTQLPSTGGLGTTLFIIIGSLLLAISSIILVTNKIMSKEY